MINLNHLRTFYTCAVHKNVSKAALDLEVTQPSLSQQIKSFETELGFDLFYRNGRILELTPKGQELFIKSEPIFSNIESVTQFLNNKEDIEKTFSIAVTDQIERPFISKIIAKLTKQNIFKNTQLKIISGNKEELESLFKKKHFNFFLSHEKHTDINSFYIFDLPVKLISCTPNHVLSSLKQTNVIALLKALDQKLVVPAKELNLRKETENAIGHELINKNIILESNIISCLTEGIKNGIGCGFLPTAYVHEEVKKNKLFLFGPQNGFWKQKIYLYIDNNVEKKIINELTKTIQNYSILEGG